MVVGLITADPKSQHVSDPISCPTVSGLEVALRVSRLRGVLSISRDALSDSLRRRANSSVSARVMALSDSKSFA